jgi:hypothetical protein
MTYRKDKRDLKPHFPGICKEDIRIPGIKKNPDA